MEVRKLSSEDIEAVVDIANRAWRPINRVSRQAVGDKIADMLRPEGDLNSKGPVVRREIEAHPENFFVCVDNGMVVGFIGCFLDYESRIGTIGHNARDPECSLKGIGQMLYQAVLAYFREQGMKAAKVFTGLDEAHAPARRAYERAGFNRSLKHVTYFMEL